MLSLFHLLGDFAPLVCSLDFRLDRDPSHLPFSFSLRIVAASRFLTLVLGQHPSSGSRDRFRRFEELVCDEEAVTAASLNP